MDSESITLTEVTLETGKVATVIKFLDHAGIIYKSMLMTTNMDRAKEIIKEYYPDANWFEVPSAVYID